MLLCVYFVHVAPPSVDEVRISPFAYFGLVNWTSPEECDVDFTFVVNVYLEGQCQQSLLVQTGFEPDTVSNVWYVNQCPNLK